MFARLQPFRQNLGVHAAPSHILRAENTEPFAGADDKKRGTDFYAGNPAETEQAGRCRPRRAVRPYLIPVTVFPVGAGAGKHRIGRGDEAVGVFALLGLYNINESVHFTETHVFSNFLNYLVDKAPT